MQLVCMCKASSGQCDYITLHYLFTLHYVTLRGHIFPLLGVYKSQFGQMSQICDNGPLRDRVYSVNSVLNFVLQLCLNHYIELESFAVAMLRNPKFDNSNIPYFGR